MNLKNFKLPFLAMAFDSIATVLIEQLTKKYNHLFLMFMWYGIAFVFMGLIYFLASLNKSAEVETLDKARNILSTSDFITIIIFTILMVGTDLMVFMAFDRNISIYLISGIVALFPIATAAVRLIYEKQLPTPYHITAYFLAVVVVVLLAKGDSVLYPDE